MVGEYNEFLAEGKIAGEFRALCFLVTYFRVGYCLGSISILS
jgi:hypothetical protein